MPKQKVTLTLDSDNLEALRNLGGSRSLSATIDQAVKAHVEKLQHLAALDDWLGEMDELHGPVAGESLEWAARLIDEWESGRLRKRKAG